MRDKLTAPSHDTHRASDEPSNDATPLATTVQMMQAAGGNIATHRANVQRHGDDGEAAMIHPMSPLGVGGMGHAVQFVGGELSSGDSAVGVSVDDLGIEGERTLELVPETDLTPQGIPLGSTPARLFLVGSLDALLSGSAGLLAEDGFITGRAGLEGMLGLEVRVGERGIARAYTRAQLEVFGGMLFETPALGSPLNEWTFTTGRFELTGSLVIGLELFDAVQLEFTVLEALIAVCQMGGVQDGVPVGLEVSFPWVENFVAWWEERRDTIARAALDGVLYTLPGGPALVPLVDPIIEWVRQRRERRQLQGIQGTIEYPLGIELDLQFSDVLAVMNEEERGVYDSIVGELEAVDQAGGEESDDFEGLLGNLEFHLQEIEERLAESASGDPH